MSHKKKRYDGDRDALPTANYRDVPCVEDGYSSLCPTCCARHGQRVFGPRTLLMEECEKCQFVPVVVNPKNISKVSSVAYLKTQPDTVFEMRKLTERVIIDGKPRYRNLESVL